MKPEKDRYNRARQIGLLTSLPFLMAVPPVVGLLIGRYLDKKISSAYPVFTIVFMLVGFAAGVREVVLAMRKANAPEKNGKGGDDRSTQ